MLRDDGMSALLLLIQDLDIRGSYEMPERAHPMVSANAATPTDIPLCIVYHDINFGTDGHVTVASCRLHCLSAVVP